MEYIDAKYFDNRLNVGDLTKKTQNNKTIISENRKILCSDN